MISDKSQRNQLKRQSAFYTKPLLERARANTAKYPWAVEMQRGIIERAEPWMKLSDDGLWESMFGHTISRSWMVWSNGYCPACEQAVPMFNWEFDAFQRPWKVRCPHCRELFPKNDFHKFYRSGLDEHGVFDPERADRRLLFNDECPNPQDPLHMFGVDDGEGYVAGDRRWRFIGAYLIYGQWKQAVLGGIKRLSAAYVATGNPLYAHKAGVLLDRVADLYSTFDFPKEAVVYEKPDGPGYVSIWHDACMETIELARSYDKVFEALKDDQELVAFVSQKADQFKLMNSKASFEDIQRNIEDHILRDALDNSPKITCNFPWTDIAIMTIEVVLGWPGNRDKVCALLDAVIEKATAVDGVTGEKGMTDYSSFTIQGLALFLEECTKLDQALLSDLLKRHPGLRNTYRFHIDTWCLEKYYPLVGDGGSFATSFDQYQGMFFQEFFQKPESPPDPGLVNFDIDPPISMYSLLWRLYKLTGDSAFVEVLYRANDNSVDGLPHDLFADDPAAIQREVAEVIAREGPVPKVGSVNKREWHLAILRSGQGADARAAWLHYDCRRAHGHADGMNLGLFAKGLDLMPDFGYPPVQYGGRESPRAHWYRTAAAHNTVVVDGEDQFVADGRTALWADGKLFRAIRLSGAELIGGKQFERTVAMVDISDRDFYIVDVFRVTGGTDHAKFMHSHFGTITTQGLSLKPADEYGHDTQMRNFYVDPAPRPGWSADWKVEDRYQFLPPDSDIHLRYTDLSFDVQAFTAEAWVSAGNYNTNQEAWIPRIMVRRQANEGPLASTFVSVIEPYEGTSSIAQIRRLTLETNDGQMYPEPNVAIEIQLDDGFCDLFVAVDVENPLSLSPSIAENRVAGVKEWGLGLDGESCMVRRDKAGEVRRIAICKGSLVTVGGDVVKLEGETDFMEVDFHEGRAFVASGDSEGIHEILVRGKRVWQR